MPETIKDVNGEDIDLDNLQDPDARACAGERDLCFGPDVERAILASALRHDTFGKLVADLVPARSFTDEAHRFIAEWLVKSLRDYKRLPSTAVIRNEIRSTIERPADRIRFEAELYAIDSYYPDAEYPPEYLAEKIKQFAEKAIIQGGFQGYSNSTKQNKPDLTPLREMMDALNRMESASGRRAYFPDELESLEPARWQIKDHLVAGAFSCVYGKYNTGKTFYVLDMALSIATGLPFLGRYAVQQGKVAYVAAEAPNGLTKRMWAWLSRHGMTFADLSKLGTFTLIPHAYDVMQQSEVAVMADLIRDKLGELPSLIVLDTLSKMMGGDYNSPKDMSAFTNNLQQLIEQGRAVGLGILPIHHIGKDASRGLVGSINLPNAIDTAIELSGNLKAGGVAVRFEKQRDTDKDVTYKVTASPVKDIPEALDPEGLGTLLLEWSEEAVQSETDKARGHKLSALDFVYGRTGDDWLSKNEIHDRVRTHIDMLNDAQTALGKPSIPHIGINRCATIIGWLHKKGHMESSGAGNGNHDKWRRTEKLLDAASYPDDELP